MTTQISQIMAVRNTKGIAVRSERPEKKEGEGSVRLQQTIAIDFVDVILGVTIQMRATKQHFPKERLPLM